MCSVWEAKTKTTQEVSKMTTELQEETRTISKIVMGWKEGTGSIGISAEGCDPYFKIAAVASIDELLPLLPEALVEAQARWSEGEQHPEYKRADAAGAGEGGQGDYHAPGGRSEARPITQIILGGQNRC